MQAHPVGSAEVHLPRRASTEARSFTSFDRLSRGFYKTSRQSYRALRKPEKQATRPPVSNSCRFLQEFDDKKKEYILLFFFLSPNSCRIYRSCLQELFTGVLVACFCGWPGSPIAQKQATQNCEWTHAQRTAPPSMSTEGSASGKVSFDLQFRRARKTAAQP